MDFLTYSKEAYIGELERRDALRRVISLLMGLSIVFAGGLFSLFKNFHWEPTSNWAPALFGISWVIGFIFLGVAVWYLIRSHIGYEYAYVPTPKEIREYHEKLTEYYASGAEEGCPDTDVEEYMAREYADNAHRNALNNNSKSSRLHRASLCLVGTLVFTGIAGLTLLLSEILR